MPVTFLTTDDGEKLLIEIGKLNKQADVLHSVIRDLSYYVQKELNPLMAKVESRIGQLDANEELIRHLESKKYKDQIIKEYTDSLVAAQK